MKQTSITVVGNVITLVNRRNVGEGRAVASFRIASTERRVDRASGEWVDGDTFYIGVTCWRELAENVAASLGVGDPVVVRGRIHTSTYDDKDGRRTSVPEIEADAVGPDLARCRVPGLQRNRRAGSPSGPPQVDAPGSHGPPPVAPAPPHTAHSGATGVAEALPVGGR